MGKGGKGSGPFAQRQAFGIQWAASVRQLISPVKSPSQSKRPDSQRMAITPADMSHDARFHGESSVFDAGSNAIALEEQPASCSCHDNQNDERTESSFGLLKHKDKEINQCHAQKAFGLIHSESFND